MRRLRHDWVFDHPDLEDVDGSYEWEDEVIERLDAQRVVRQAMGTMTPMERRAVFDMLCDRPARDESDRQARKRARIKIRRHFHASKP